VYRARTHDVASRDKQSSLAENRHAVFPLLAAWYSVLVLAVAHVGASGHVHMVAPALLFATIVGLLGWLLSGLATRDPDRRTILAVGFVAWFVAYGALARPLLDMGASPRLAFGIMAAFAFAFAVLVRRMGAVVTSIARFVRVAVVIVLAFPLFSFASFQVRKHTADDAPEHGVVVDPPPPGAPSIFLIVLDKYTGSRSLRANYGFDNGGFEDRLRNRGFVVPRAARSNYPHTWMTLASMLNWTFLSDLLETPERLTAERIKAAIADGRTTRFLKERGYEFVFMPSPYYATASSALADRQIPEPARRGTNITSAWMLSSAAYALPGVLGGRVRLRGLFPYAAELAADFAAKFEILARLAEEPGARFVFAHLLLPHEPYIFDEECGHRDPWWPPTDYVPDQGPIRAAYTAQIRCLNRKLEELVDQILAASTVPPIIILQADHGHGMIALDPLRGDQLPLDQLEAWQVEERTDVFAAYYLPDGGHDVIYDSITPVNVLPEVLNYYFDAGIPLNEDAIFWARLHPPFELTRIQ
jgi:hypothetical protein